MEIYLIHCAGKVASASITRALGVAGLNENGSRVFKTHILNEDTLAAAIKRNATGISGHLAHTKEFLELFRRPDLERCCLIIGQRDPVAQALSTFFQNLTIYMKMEEVTLANFDAVMAMLERAVPAICIKSGVRWWDVEVKDVFGLDVFAYDFDKRRGVTALRPTGTLTVVLYNLERGIHHLPGVLEEVSGRSPIEIPVENTVADSNWYKPYKNYDEVELLYKQAKAGFRIPVSVLEGIYDQPAVRFFYDDEQIAGFRERWKAAE